jgi:predicted Zn finger-like uncharacterized protein
MKIVCGSCGAKYSIADEKVQGKVFKIRCRKCSNVIVVKGSADGSSVEHLSAADAAEPMSSDFGGTAAASEWYVVIDGEQAGPMTPDEVEAQFASGRITAESFVWRDGMGDWSVLRDVEIFRHLVAQRGEEATHIVESPLRGAQRLAQEDPDGATAVVDGGLVRAAMEQSHAQQSAYDSFGSFGSSQPMAAAPAPHSSAQPAAGGFAASFGGGLGMNAYNEPASNNDGLFASLDKGSNGGLAYQSFAGIGSSSSFGSLELGGSGAATASVRPSESARSVASAPAASNGGGSPELISARNENSVLFSLSSLQKVEAVKADAGKDVPVTEGSGLIDIKSLATTHQAMMSGKPRDEAPVDVFAPGTMSMPAIMPRGSHRNNKPLFVAIGALSLLVVVGLGVVIYILATKEPEKEIVKEVIVKEAVPVDVPKTSGMSKEEVEAMLAEERLKMAAANANKPAEHGGEEVGGKDDGGKTSKKSGDKKSGDKVAVKGDDKGNDKPAAKPAEDKPKSDKKKSSDSIDSLMEGLDKEPKKMNDSKKAVAAVKEKEPEPAAQEKLSKSDVQNTINKYAARVDDCASSSNKGALKGTMFVKFSVEPSGAVSDPTVDSANFKGTDVGECVIKVVKSMKFPASQQGIPSIKYPFILR